MHACIHTYIHNIPIAGATSLLVVLLDGLMDSIFPTMDFYGDVIEVRFIYMYACMYVCMWWPYGFHISDHGFLCDVIEVRFIYMYACMYVCMWWPYGFHISDHGFLWGCH
jgi:hypothetical protein